MAHEVADDVTEDEVRGMAPEQFALLAASCITNLYRSFANWPVVKANAPTVSANEERERETVTKKEREKQTNKQKTKQRTEDKQTNKGINKYKRS